ncbi:hypothetical protein [Pleionea sediminis]|uniref:hypothetical protein n=1 Tax=Pleionea sediminis TaxID=2569479 RepID=UPI0011861C4C|nr:hypothetical protein [Pleionea sediminis]
MGFSKITNAANTIAKDMASTLLRNHQYSGLPIEDLIDQACRLDQTRQYFLNHGIDLTDDSIQLQALSEFQKALSEEIIRAEN